MEIFVVFIGIFVVEIFSFITMKFYWPNKIFGILYQLIRIILCIFVFRNYTVDETGMYCILYGILEFLIISNLIGQAGCQDDRDTVEDVSSVDIAGDTIIRISKRNVGDSAWGNMLSSLGYSAIIAGIIAFGCYFLFEFKPVIGGIIFLVISVVRIFGIIHRIIRDHS